MKAGNGFRARTRYLCAFQVEIISPLGVGTCADQDELGVVDIEQANVLTRKAAIAKLASGAMLKAFCTSPVFSGSCSA
jgi:hypothetical protein